MQTYLEEWDFKQEYDHNGEPKQAPDCRQVKLKLIQA